MDLVIVTAIMEFAITQPHSTVATLDRAEDKLLLDIDCCFIIASAFSIFYTLTSHWLNLPNDDISLGVQIIRASTIPSNFTRILWG